MKVGIKTNRGKGKFQLLINGVNQGSEQDEYSSGVGYEILDLGIVKLDAGDQMFQFLVTGTSGTGYQLVFDYIDLVPRFETEALPAQATAPHGPFIDPMLSGGQGTLLQSTRDGDSVTYTVPVAVAGTYDVNVGIKTNKGKGIFQLSINGINQGYPQDEYSPGRWLSCSSRPWSGYLRPSPEATRRSSSRSWEQAVLVVNSSLITLIWSWLLSSRLRSCRLRCQRVRLTTRS